MKSILTLLTVFFIINFSQSQQLGVQWTDYADFDTEELGIYSDIVGETDTKLYSLVSTYEFKVASDHNQYYMLRVYDKSSLEVIKDVQVTQKTDLPNKMLAFRPFRFEKLVVIEGSIVFFYTILFEDKAVLYAILFDEDLNIKKKESKILESPKTMNGFQPEFFISVNEETKTILTGVRNGGQYNDSVFIECRIFDANMLTIESNKILFPWKIQDFPIGNYSLLSDEFFYFRFNVQENVTPDEKRVHKQEYKYYPALALISAKTGQMAQYSVDFEDKKTSGIQIESRNNICNLFGFFSDLKLDPTGKRDHGFFKVQLDLTTNTSSNPQFTYFNEDAMAQIYANDDKLPVFRENEWPEVKGLVIEATKKLPDGDQVLICSRVIRYGSEGSYSQYDKIDITSFRINPAGEIQWLKTSPRRYTFRRNSNADIRLMYDESSGNLLCTYCDRNGQKQKSADSDSRTELDYIVIDTNTGSMTPKKLALNSASTSEKDMKYVIHKKILSFGNNFYYFYFADKKGRPSEWDDLSWKRNSGRGCLGKFEIR